MEYSLTLINDRTVQTNQLIWIWPVWILQWW